MFICLSSPTVFVRRSIKANDRLQPIYALVQVMNTSSADALFWVSSRASLTFTDSVIYFGQVGYFIAVNTNLNNLIYTLYAILK